MAFSGVKINYINEAIQEGSRSSEKSWDEQRQNHAHTLVALNDLAGFAWSRGGDRRVDFH
jgi:hypothetical protein